MKDDALDEVLKDYIDRIAEAQEDHTSSVINDNDYKQLAIETRAARDEAKAAIAAHIQEVVVAARIDENRTYWWHQQKAAEAESVSSHALKRIAELQKGSK